MAPRRGERKKRHQFASLELCYDSAKIDTESLS